MSKGLYEAGACHLSPGFQGILVVLIGLGCGSDPKARPGGGGGPASGGAGGISVGGATGGVSAGGTSAGGTSSGGTTGGGTSGGGTSGGGPSLRTRLSINDAWRFTKNDPQIDTSALAYSAAKAWVLPTGNPFVKDPADHAVLPAGNPGDGVPYIASDFDDSSWRSLDLPHDYAIEGPYTTSISGSMGHLPSIGVAWYRKTFDVAATDAGKSFFLDIDGAMSYSMVWINGQFAGGWPYGYASYRLNITPHVQTGANVIAIRLDNPVPVDSQWDSGSSRWYPGAGIYRNVWLVTTEPVHVSHWGTFVTTPEVSQTSAAVQMNVSVDNDSREDVTVSIATEIFELDAAGARSAAAVASIAPVDVVVLAGLAAATNTTGAIANPKLWGTPPTQTPNLYEAVTTLSVAGMVVDVYETRFGVRTLEFDPDLGFFLNGEHVKMNGVCNHHDLGALGAAFNYRAAERQFQILAEMGSNAFRTAHNPSAPELLEIADRMGFLVMNEAFDVWEDGKADFDHHLFFPEWHEQDLRALLRRDRNHPSVVMWSIGNELVEQSDAVAGPALGQELTTICHEEDPTRPTVAGMNSANANSPFPGPIDSVGLNYQGTGVRGGPPEYPDFHSAFPQKFVVGTETTDAYSSRGFYTFPVASGSGEPAANSSGVDNAARQVSSYDLYFADWSYFPDAEFRSQDTYSFVGGEFVWTGFDYLGEPSPFDSSRSSYSGIIDLAGFKKDRFYLYQAYWRPDLPMVHILPHWTWPERTGQVTPVHVYTSGDEAELFLNGASLGRKSKAQYEYRLRWDDVVYQAGEIGVVAYKNGVQWATATVQTAGAANKLLLAADRSTIAGDGRDLSFVTLTVVDQENRMVPRAMNAIQFEVSGPGQIVATDNGNPTDQTLFSSPNRNAFNAMALAIVRAAPGQTGQIVLTASSQGLTAASVTIVAE